MKYLILFAMLGIRQPIVNSGLCQSWVKWQVKVVVAEPYVKYTEGSIPVELVEFWSAPGTDIRLTIEALAKNGAWGGSYVDGFHNNAYQRYFFPPSQIINLRYEFDCLK